MSLDDITLAVDYFDLKKIAESGQCFRWKELGPGKYLIPSGQACAIMEQKEPDDDLHLLIEEGATMAGLPQLRRALRQHRPRGPGGHAGRRIP